MKRLWLRVRWGKCCAYCGTAPWLNPPSDHAAWLGHRWRRGKERSAAP